jgi:hypothetical protein
MSDDNFLSRWSRRKIEARKGDVQAPEPAPAPASSSQVVPQQQTPPPPEPLPPLESLTPHSDFSPFMREGVDPAVKGRALKTLFSDPALYPMDGLDVYIDDYSKPDPLPEGWLEKLNQYAALDSHNQPEREAEASKAPAIPATPPPTESAASSPVPVSGPRSSGSPSDTSAAPPAAPDATNRDAV